MFIKKVREKLFFLLPFMLGKSKAKENISSWQSHKRVSELFGQIVGFRYEFLKGILMSEF